MTGDPHLSSTAGAEKAERACGGGVGRLVRAEEVGCHEEKEKKGLRLAGLGAVLG
jgi:hypothetical protein